MTESTAAIDFYSPIDPATLPNDPMVLKQLLLELLKVLKSETKRREEVERNMDLLIRQLNKPRGLKPGEGQQVLFDVSGPAEPVSAEPSVAEPPAPPVIASSEAAARKRTPHGRRRPPQNLEQREVIHDLSDDAKQQLGGPDNLLPLPDVVTYKYEYEAARLIVVKHVQKKYLRRDLANGASTSDRSQGNDVAAFDAGSDDTSEQTAASASPKIILASKPPEVLPGCQAAPGMLSFIWLSKYGDHLPLYRLERITQRYGLSFPRSTTCDWMMNLGDGLGGLMGVAIDEVLKSKVLHTDDTSVRMQDPETGQVRIARFWNYLGDEEHPLTVFDFTLSRQRDGPATFLKNYQGHLQADAYSVYDGIYLGSEGRIVEVACWQHARAKYKEALASDPTRAAVALAHIKCLYTVEQEIRELNAREWQGLPLEERVLRIEAIRRAKSVPVLDAFKIWLDGVVRELLPKSPLAEAVRYTLNQWQALRVYITCGRLAIDNNAAERAHRGIAIGRKNWLFVGSERGGRAAAVHFSFIASCVRNKIDPFAWLVDILHRLPATAKEEWVNLLPHRWKPAIKS
jgi:hypothetical protein